MARHTVVAEVPGVVSKIERGVGERVARDEPILIVELMKMEVPVPAPVDGTLIEMRVAEGDTISEGQKLAVIETD
jgi:acetyl-CoA carboxylase biotin carboxyl carrier protein